MDQLQTFNFNDNEVRTVLINNEPYFVGKDVASILGYERTDNAIRNHIDEDDKLMHQISASGQNRLFQWMRENGYLIRKGSSKNMPTQKSMDMGLMEIKERTITNPDGSLMITKTTKITGKGQVYFVNKLCMG